MEAGRRATIYPRWSQDHHYKQNFGEQTMNEKAERINGLAAMIGIIAALGAYAVTGQIIPGVW